MGTVNEYLPIGGTLCTYAIDQQICFMNKHNKSVLIITIIESIFSTNIEQSVSNNE